MTTAILTVRARAMQRMVVLSVLICPARAFMNRKITTFLPLSVSLHVPVQPSARFFSATPGTARPDIQNVGREHMEEIIEDYEEGGRDASQYCVIDVRTEEEVNRTGKLGENVYTLPVQVIQLSKVFEMEPDEFLETCKFEKPSPDETLVFSCAAGIRSVSACQFAAQAGYTKLINYTGGANEWFSPKDQ